jgi:hypothetical protein
METKYYIYHIPTFVWKNGGVGKIGVSEEPKIRVKSQKYSDYEILETHTDIMEVSRREIELQKEYGYKVDFLPYWKTIKTAKTGVGGRAAAGKGGRNNSKENKIKAGKIGGKGNRSITFEDAQLIRKLYSTKKYKQRQLGEMYNVSREVIAMITSNRTYTQP